VLAEASGTIDELADFRTRPLPQSPPSATKSSDYASSTPTLNQAADSCPVTYGGMGFACTNQAGLFSAEANQLVRIVSLGIHAGIDPMFERLDPLARPRLVTGHGSGAHPAQDLRCVAADVGK
jgi:hypothetical protein